MAMYKKPTEAQRAKIQRARKMTREGMEGEDDLLSRISTTMRKGARDQQKIGRKMMEEVPQEVRNYENEEGAEPMGPYKKGGKVMKYAKGGVTEYGGMEKYASKSAMKKHEAKESPSEEKMEKKMGKNMARATMQKVATGAVKKHEKSMHGMKKGGMACGGMKKYAKGGSIDGCAKRGKTKGRMV